MCIFVSKTAKGKYIVFSEKKKIPQNIFTWEY